MALLLTRKDSPLLLDAHFHETKLTLQQGSIQRFAITTQNIRLMVLPRVQYCSIWIYEI
ncbi:MAG: hypothetical protein HON51_03865 [Gammaproteobacteria bacterium]|jgi:hypothetical protein|nr:hypothetical protein [Gammaproteobacteria bacterium]MBT5221570.1 hypothetical protein [Gammaproteobacteria bacterium]MBT5826797.1 hypothetical protein [Gammaproteobacteria bacterium]MBT5967713.1 hypothetical protein [Gammaproteobacteria bacterium]MBT6419611.1 hypothetical protein [Gammaproteobacteria bacterium]